MCWAISSADLFAESYFEAVFDYHGHKQYVPLVFDEQPSQSTTDRRREMSVILFVYPVVPIRCCTIYISRKLRRNSILSICD